MKPFTKPTAVRRSRSRYTPALQVLEARIVLDVGDTLATAYATNLRPGFSGEFRLHHPDLTRLEVGADVDLYRLTAVPSMTLRAETIPLAWPGDPPPQYRPPIYAARTVLRLFTERGTPLALNEECSPGSWGACLDYTFNTSGTFYVGVSARGNRIYDPTVARSGTGQSTGMYLFGLNLTEATQGLRGEYFANATLTAPSRFTRVDPTPVFVWPAGTAPDPTLPSDNFSVRWTGTVEPLYSDTYTFYTRSDDGVRLWVDNRLIIDNWTDHAPRWDSGTVTLRGGETFAIRLEYYDRDGGGEIDLHWSSPRQARQGVPASQLRPQGRLAQTIQFDPIPAQEYTYEPIRINARASSGLPLRYETSTFCHVESGHVYLDYIGTCRVTAFQEGNANYFPALPVYHQFGVSRGRQRIDFAPLPNRLYGEGPFTLSAIAGSRLPVRFGVYFPSDGSCSVTGTTLTITAAGTCTVVANQDGDMLFFPATTEYRTFTVARANQAITFPALPDRTFGDAPFSVSAMASSGLPVSFTADGSCTVVGASVTLTGAGTCTVTASQAGDRNWIPAPTMTRTFTIEAGDLLAHAQNTAAVAGFGTFSWDDALGNGTRGNQDVDLFRLDLPARGFVTARTVSPRTAVSADTVLRLFDGQGRELVVNDDCNGRPYSCLGMRVPTAGTYYVGVSGRDNSAYDPTRGDGRAAGATGAYRLNLVLGDADQGLRAEYFDNTTLSGAPRQTRVEPAVQHDWTAAQPHPALSRANFSARWTGGIVADASGPHTFHSRLSNAARLWVNDELILDKPYSGSVVEVTSRPIVLAAGQVVAFRLEYFGPAPNQPLHLSWAPPGQERQLIPQGRLVPRAPAPGLRGEYQGGRVLNGPTAVTRVDAAVDFDWGTEQPHPAIGPDNFAVRWTGQVLPRVTGRHTFQTTTDDGVRLWIDGELLIDQWRDQAPTAYAGTIDLEAGRAYDVWMEYYEAAAGAVARLAWAYPGQGMQVIPTDQLAPLVRATQMITFAALADRPFRPDPIALTATASSGLTVRFAAAGACTVSGAALRLTSEGSCTVTASQSGNHLYHPAPAVARTFTIARAAQTISFPPVSGRLLSAGSFSVNPTASSGLLVQVTAAGTCTVVGLTITPTAAGTCTLTATQAGDASFLPAPPVTQNIIIARGTQTITFSPLPDRTFGDAPFSVSATASSGLPVTLSASGNCTLTGNTVRITGGGSCTITAHQAGNLDYVPVTTPRTFAIARAGQTINTFGAFSRPFSFDPFTPPWAATSGLPVTYRVDSGPCTTDGRALRASTYGGCNLTASQAGDANYLPAPPVVATYFITAVRQVIDFPPVVDPPAGLVSFTVRATANSGLPVLLTAAGACDVSGLVVTVLGVGPCTLTATRPAEGGYLEPIPPTVQRSFYVEAGDTLAAAVVLGVSAVANSFSAVELLGNGAQAARDVDLYRLDVAPRAFLNARTVAPRYAAPAWDTVLRLFDAQGRQVAANDDCEGRPWSCLGFRFSAGGTYYLGVSGRGNATYDPTRTDGRSNGVTGEYRLNVVVEEPDQGLRAEYFDNAGLVGAPRQTRVDPQVNQSWGLAAPHPSIPTDLFAVRWTGLATPRATGLHTFAVTADGGVRLWVNSVLVIDEWRDRPETRWSSAPLTLTAGQPALIRLEYFDASAVATARLLWAYPGQAEQVIPQEHLSPQTGPGGLSAEYFDNITLSGTPRLARFEESVNHGWGAGGPHSLFPVDNFSARWTGLVIPRVTGDHVFHASADDGVRLWVNGELLLDEWRDQRGFFSSRAVRLTAGQPAALRMEYYERGGDAEARLYWSYPGQAAEIIPSTQLAALHGGQGLRGEYFGGVFPGGPTVLSRVDAGVQLDWGAGAPHPALNPDRFSVRWTGQVLPPRDGTFTFWFTTQGGVRLWVNGELLSEFWVDWGGQPSTFGGQSLLLTAGQRYDVWLEHFESAGGASIQLLWTYPEQSPAIPVPASNLRPQRKSDQAIEVLPLPDRVLGEAPFRVPVLTTSGLSARLSGSGSCTVMGQTVTLTGAGTCTLTATQPGNDTYYAAAPVSRSFQITPGPQTITFPALADRHTGETPYVVPVTASSGLPVRLTASGSCTASGVTVRLVDVGLCHLVATQPGDANWEPAFPVGRSFYVEAGDTLAAALDLGMASGQGSFSSGERLGNGFQGGRDVDLYRFQLLPGSAVQVRTVAPGLGVSTDTVLRLFDAQGQQAALNDDCDGQPFSCLSFRSSTGGTYYLGVSGRGNAAYDPTRLDGRTNGATGEYRLTVAVMDPYQGLRAEVFDNRDLAGAPRYSYVEPTVSHNYGLGGPHPLLPSDNFSIRWTGLLTPQVTGMHTFFLNADDGVRLWVNDQLVLNQWQAGQGFFQSQPITLTAGRAVPIRLEYFEASGGARVLLYWSWTGQSAVIIPQSQLATLPSPALRGEYYADGRSNGPSQVTRLDPTIHFDWGQAAPHAALPADNFHVRWTGYLYPQTTGDHTFSVTADDGVRLWINGELLLDQWRDQAPTRYTSWPIRLTAGQGYDIWMEYYEAAVGAVARLEWAYPGQADQVIPSGRLRPQPQRDQVIAFVALADRTYGEPPVALQATASSGLPVQFTASGSCTVSGAILTLTGAGMCSVTAAQAGNPDYYPATPVTRTFTVARAGTRTAVVSSLNPSVVGEAVTFTATVTSLIDNLVPDGNVTFLDGATILGSAALNAAGVATFTTTSLAVGSRRLTARYNGQSNFLTSTSAELVQLVDPVMIAWLNPAGGDWHTPANWSTGRVPVALQDVVISLAGTYTVALSQTAAVRSLTLGGAAGTQTLRVSGAVELHSEQASTVQTSGSLHLEDGALFNGLAGVINRGAMVVARQATFSSSVLQTQGTVILADGVLSIATPLSVEGGSLSGWGFVLADVVNAGRIEAGGTDPEHYLGIFGTLTNDAAGTLSVPDGRSLYTFGGEIRTAGRVSVGGNGLLYVEGVYRQTDGTTTLMGGVLSAVLGLDIQAGQLGGWGFMLADVVNAGRIEAGGTDSKHYLGIFGTLINDVAGTLSVPDGRSLHTFGGEIRTAGYVSVGDGGTLYAEGAFTQTTGELTLAGGTVIAGPLFDLQGGLLSGSGNLFADVRNAGRIQVGGLGAAGALFISGDYTQTDAGELHMEMGDFDSGAYDRLTIAGTAALGGTLTVELLDGFFAREKDDYRLLECGTRSGEFMAVIIPDIGGGLFLDPRYDDTGLSFWTTQS